MKQVVLIVFACLFTLSVWSKGGEWVTFKGKVVDAETQIALIGAKITFGDNVYSVYTDPDGYFEIDIPTEFANRFHVELISYKPSSFELTSLNSQNLFELSSW